jgi:hypothetical protein
MNAPVIEFRPAAPRKHWLYIASLFRAGHDTLDIARIIGLSEAHVANALNAALREAT